MEKKIKKNLLSLKDLKPSDTEGRFVLCDGMKVYLKSLMNDITGLLKEKGYADKNLSSVELGLLDQEVIDELERCQSESTRCNKIFSIIIDYLTREGKYAFGEGYRLFERKYHQPNLEQMTLILISL